LQDKWPDSEDTTFQKEQAPATIPTDSTIRRLYLLALIDATKHPQIHGHPTLFQTAAQILPLQQKIGSNCQRRGGT
jgi:ribosomal protein L31